MVHVNNMLVDVNLSRLVIYWWPVIPNSAGSLVLGPVNKLFYDCLSTFRPYCCCNIIIIVIKKLA